MVLVITTLCTPYLWTQNRPSKQEEIQAHTRRAQQALRSSDFASAEREFRAILTLDPNNLDARGNVGAMRYFQGDWAGAAEQFRKVLESQSKMWKIQAFLGMCQDRLGRPSEARRLLEAALPHLHEGPFKTQAGLELAQNLYQSGDLDRAVDVVRILLPFNPKNPDVLYTAARVYADLANRSRDALALAAPDSARTHQLMAEFLINRGDTRAAIIQYRKALELAPTLGGLPDELGDAILLDSRQPPALEAAEKEFRAALAENPADANAEYRLGTIYSLRHDYKTAIQHYARALQLLPENAYAQQELGWAWFKMGEPEKALEHLLAANRLDPLFPTTHYQLGTLYRRLGRETDARRELATFEKLEEARKQIDQVYFRTRPAFGETDSPGPNASNK